MHWGSSAPGSCCQAVGWPTFPSILINIWSTSDQLQLTTEVFPWTSPMNQSARAFHGFPIVHRIWSTQCCPKQQNQIVVGRAKGPCGLGQITLKQVIFSCGFEIWRKSSLCSASKLWNLWPLLQSCGTWMMDGSGHCWMRMANRDQTGHSQHGQHSSQHSPRNANSRCPCQRWAVMSPAALLWLYSLQHFCNSTRFSRQLRILQVDTLVVLNQGPDNWQWNCGPECCARKPLWDTSTPANAVVRAERKGNCEGNNQEYRDSQNQTLCTVQHKLEHWNACAIHVGRNNMSSSHQDPCSKRQHHQ